MSRRQIGFGSRIHGCTLALLSLLCSGLVASAQADIYADITSQPTAPVTPAYFGVHFHRLAPLPAEHVAATAWPDLSFGSVRLWDAGTAWRDIAPRGGVWDFSRVETVQQMAAAHNADVLLTLGSTPQWASSRPDEPCPYGKGCAAEPVRLAHWDEYVRRTAAHFGTRITAYEVWNEPFFSDVTRDRGQTGFYTGSIANMVEMTRSARRILREVAPHATLCSPGFVNGPDRLEYFLAAGGAAEIQAVCYHFYAENSDHFAEQIKAVRSIMARQGIAHLPLWNTETGVETQAPSEPYSSISARSEPEATARLSQMLVLGAAAGLAHFYYYAYDNGRSGLIDRNGRPLPGWDTMRRLQNAMLGLQFTGCNRTAALVLCHAVPAATAASTADAAPTGHSASGSTLHYVFAWSRSNQDSVQAPLPVPPGSQALALEPLRGDASDLSALARVATRPFVFGPMPVRIAYAP